MTGEYEGQTAVLYARVSTDDKDQRPESQMEVIEGWCRREGVSVVGRYMEEQSAKDMSRPQFQAAIGRIVTGAISSAPANGEVDPSTCKVNLLVAWHQTRISRDQADFLNIKRLVEGYGCVIRFVSNLIRTETSAGQLITSIDAWHGQVEREKLSDNTRMGMRQRKAAGQYLSRPRAVVFEEDLPGYTLKGEVRTDDAVRHKTVITTERDVYRWAAEGLSVERIAKEKLFVSYGAFYQLLKDTGRLGRFREVGLSSRDVPHPDAESLSVRGAVGKGGETPDFSVVKGCIPGLSSREPLPTGGDPCPTDEEEASRWTSRPTGGPSSWTPG